MSNKGYDGWQNDYHDPEPPDQGEWTACDGELCDLEAEEVRGDLHLCVACAEMYDLGRKSAEKDMQRALICCQDGDYVMAAYILGEALRESK